MIRYQMDHCTWKLGLFHFEIRGWLMLECILTPSRDLAYMEGAAPINPTCVQLLHQLMVLPAQRIQIILLEYVSDLQHPLLRSPRV
jgi:hypothetical protein